MYGFKLDTSGAVNIAGLPAADCLHKARWGASLQFEWMDLPPFMQDYVEAMLQERVEDDTGRNVPLARLLGFSDLAPETLARIIEDCARFNTDHPGGLWVGGADFYRMRQGHRLAEFPPVTISLSDDDGKVRLNV